MNQETKDAFTPGPMARFFSANKLGRLHCKNKVAYRRTNCWFT